MLDSIIKSANKKFREGKLEESLADYMECIKAHPEMAHSLSINISIILKILRNRPKSYSPESPSSSYSDQNSIYNTATLSNLDNISVCLITEEIAGIHPSGGIGAAFLELGRLLSASGISVDILVCNTAFISSREKIESIKERCNFARRVEVLDPSIYTTPSYTPNKISYSIYQWLKERNSNYKFIHFHDYKGLAYFSCEAKAQGLDLHESKIVIQVHGPTRWALEANSAFFSHIEQLRFDYMEKKSIEMADTLVAPSNYILGWIKEKRFANIEKKKTYVIKNCPARLPFTRSNSEISAGQTRTIIYFGRQEERKGIKTFCNALSIIRTELEKTKTKVIFLGGLGEINEGPSLIYLLEASKDWNFRYSIIHDLSRDDALEYILNQSSPLVCICSEHENSPYTVSEMISLGIPFITSRNGGAIELIRDPNYPGIIDMNSNIIANSIITFIHSPWGSAESSQEEAEIRSQWLQFHRENIIEQNEVKKSMPPSSRKNPLITVVVTTFDRPKKLLEAIRSITLQSYRNIEIIVVDDASKTSEAIFALEQQLPLMLHGINHQIIRRKSNGYLGAARNSGLSVATGEYIIYLDDDDYAISTMLEKLLLGAQNTCGDVIIALNAYMPESERHTIIWSDHHRLIPSYVPTGGPHSLSAIENCIGAATSLIKTSLLKKIGGYSELKGVGHEDYELYIKLLQAGARIHICPEVLYMYETGRPSMLSNTSLQRNFQRNFEAYSPSESTKDLISLIIGERIQNMKSSRMAWRMPSIEPYWVNKLFDTMWDPKIHIKSLKDFLEVKGQKESLFFEALSQSTQHEYQTS